MAIFGLFWGPGPGFGLILAYFGSPMPGFGSFFTHVEVRGLNLGQVLACLEGPGPGFEPILAFFGESGACI